MKPCSRKVLRKSLLSQEITLSERSTIACIKGSVKKIGVAYQKVTIVLYSKANFLPIFACKPDNNGEFEIFGLNTEMNCFCVAISSELKNARIFDRVKPE